MPISDILSRKLKQLDPGSSGEWQVWEHKTLNLHRAVLEWTPGRVLRSYSEVSHAVRAEVARRLKVAWWRGMGFGVVVHLAAPPEGLAACVDDIDGRQNTRGTWQWSIFVFQQSRAAVGVHMWLRGYLSTVYEQTLACCESEGCRIASCQKDKDRLMQFLTLVHPLPEYVGPGKTPEGGAQSDRSAPPPDSEHGADAKPQQ